MSHRAVPFRLGVGPCALGLLLSLTLPAGAQTGSLRGKVLDQANQPLGDAVVLVDSLDRVFRTDASGRFQFGDLPRGELGLTVRRLGFAQRNVRVIITGRGVDEVLIAMEPQRVVLPTISVSEARRRQGILEFHRRRERGMGTYFTREDLLARSASVPSDLVRTTPGIRLVRSRTGRGIRFTSTSIIRRDCMPMMWVDGARAPGLELDDVPVHDIEGIELYHGPSTTPMEFSPGPVASCGTIVVWTRQPGG